MKKDQSIFVYILLLSITVVLSGCAGISRTPLDKANAAKLSTIGTKISVPQDEVIIKASASNVSAAMGGGLIAALIDASVSKSRQEKIETSSEKFYEKMQSVDFRSLFGKGFTESISSQTVLPKQTIFTSSVGISKDEIEERKQKLLPGEGFLGVRIFYELSNDHKKIVVIANVQLINKESPQPLYTNTFIYLSDAQPDGFSLITSAAEQPKILADIFQESGQQIAFMLNHDLNAPSNEIIAANRAKQEKIKVVAQLQAPFILAPNGSLVSVSGDTFVELKNGSRYISRSEGGALFSIGKF